MLSLSFQADFPMVNTDSSITYHVFDKFLWVRCANRGSFVNSSILKSIADQYIDDGGRCVVVDLEICAGVDSTFMGTMAGIARRLMPLGGALQVATPSERARAALESLGLDALMEIDPPTAPWRGHLDELRAVLHSSDIPMDMPDLERTKHVLDAHNTLSDLSPENAEQFKYVRESLEEEIKRKG